MAKVIWTEESLTWLKEIDEYLARTSVTAAVNVLEGIIGKVEMLCEHPRLGAQMSDIAEREIRDMLYDQYRIIYEFNEDVGAVHILAVVHSAMDIDRLSF